METSLNQPLVSVLLSVYNSELHLKDAIESILNQSYPHFELIIVNDGSVDSSEKIIDSFQDKRILKINNPGNKGLIFSLNKAFEAAKGNYIARMDADDISLPERFKKQVDFLESHPEIGLCSCHYTQFNSSDKYPSQSLIHHEEIISHLLFNSSLAHPTLMIRRSVLLEQKVVYDMHYPHAEDYELWTRLALKTKFGAVEEQLFLYRLHENQVTQKYHQQQIESGNKIREKFLAALGFICSAEELRVHCLLGSSSRIEKMEDLLLLQTWLEKMLVQNKENQKIPVQVFTPIIGKYWYDACGITKLGLRAFFAYNKSSVLCQAYQGNRLKLLVKTMLRRFNF